MTTFAEQLSTDPLYRTRGADDILRTLQFAPDGEQVPAPDTFDDAPNYSKSAEQADKVDVMYFGVMPVANEVEAALYGQTREESQADPVVVVYDPKTILPTAVWQTASDLTQRAVAHGSTQGELTATDNNRGVASAHLAQAENYSILTLEADKFGLSAAMFIEKGGYAPEMAKDRMNQIVENAGKAFPAVFGRMSGELVGAALTHVDLAQEDLPPVPLSGAALSASPQAQPNIAPTEGSVRGDLFELFNDVATNYNATLVQQKARQHRNPGSEDLVEAVLEASTLRVDSALHAIGLAPQSRDDIEADLKAYLMEPTDAARQDWLEMKGLDEPTRTIALRENVQASTQALPAFRDYNFANTLTGANLIQQGEKGGKVAGILRRLRNILPQKTPKTMMMSPAIQTEQQDRSEAVPTPNIMQGISEKLNNTYTRILLAAGARPDSKTFIDQETGKVNVRGRMAIAGGVLATAALVTGASWMVAKYGSHTLIDSIALPSGSDKLSNANDFSSGMPARNVPGLQPDGGLALDQLPLHPAETASPELFKLADWHTIWEYAQTHLAPGASATDVYNETVRIMQANGLPTDALGPDPLEAARHIAANTELVNPKN